MNKKLLSAIAVLAISGSVALSAGVLSACKDNGDGITYAAPNGEFSGNVYYVAPYGKIENDGTTASKAKDPSFLNDVETLQAGDTVYLVPGVYKWDPVWGANHTFNSQAIAITANGAPGKNISFINAALDERSGYTGKNNKVLFDFSKMEFAGANRGVQIYGNYIYWYGIDVCGAGDNGLYVGGSYNTIEYCEFYNNRDTGLQLGRRESAQSNINQWPSYNLIKNCTSHNNYDDETYGENADGFAAKLTLGYGNVFDGCIAYRNSDDGWDLYAKSDSGNIGCVIIYNCVAFENGYLEYTQKEMHSKLNYKPEFNEPELNSFKTRDGDGNGFKLGGSVMEGDVKMYNCLAFQNRMHGVTDNSNPGYLMIEGVTSYDNSAAIDNNPSSKYFGKVVSINNHDTHGNIDVARQEYSYNTVKNVLSVKSDIPKSLGNDAYRGSVSDSLLNAGTNTRVIKGSIDADTKTAKGAKYTTQIEALKAEDVFKKLPVVANGSNYTYNIDGSKDMNNKVANRVHAKYRNADHSINMGDILAIKDGFDFSATLGTGVTAGSTLNKKAWDQYTHFVDEGLLQGVTSEVYATLLKAKETLTLNTDATQVYQDFEVPTKILDATIEWTTDDGDLLTIGRETEISVSKTEYITIGVTRPTDAPKEVKLTATIFYRNSSIKKEFTLTVMKDTPSIGELYVMVTENDEKYINGGKIIMDAYRQFGEPELMVENGAYYNGTLLTKEQYTCETKYEYAESASATYTEVKSFMVNHPGVFRITHTVKLNGSSSTASMSYQIFVAEANAVVDIQHTVNKGTDKDPDYETKGGAEVSVYRDGYIIAGDLTNVTGTLYTVASATALPNLTVANIKDHPSVESNAFRATNISFSYANLNNAGYHIYYALANANDKITSQLYHVEIVAKNVSSTSDFMKIAGGEQLASEEVSQTIYLLTTDLDFNGVTYSTAGKPFSGLLNGQGHTISNVTVSGSKEVGLFKTVKGGTIENIKFNNIKITNSGETSGIIALSKGGYYYNIAITNIKVTGTNRQGGLIGQASEGAILTDISQVSLINPIPEYDAETGALPNAANSQGYFIYASGTRSAGILAFAQTSNIANHLTVKVADCYVESYIFCGSYSCSSIVGEYNENGQLANAKLSGYDMSLEIENCVSAGVLVNNGTGRIGGMLGYHNGPTRLSIMSCVAVHKAYYKSALLLAAQKNQSGIVGNFNTSAGVQIEVGRCISYMEEYNTDYDVTMYTEEQLGNIMAFANTTFDTDTKWTYKYKAGSTVALERPYLELNFLGDWN